MLRCRPGRRSPALDHRLGARRHAAHDVARERVVGATRPSSPARRPAPAASRRAGRSRRRAVAGRRQAARRPRRRAGRSRRCRPSAASSRASARRGHRGDRAGAQRGDRAGVEQHQRLAGARVGEADHAGHRRQAARGVARERGDPLQQREAVAAAPASRGSRRTAGSRGRPSAASPTPRAWWRTNAVAHALDRLRRTSTAASTASWSSTGTSGTGARTIPSARSGEPPAAASTIVAPERLRPRRPPR